MKVRDIMTNPAVALNGEDTVCEAARLMQAHDVGLLPVINEKNSVEGIITDRDIVLRCISTGKDACKVKVKEVMTTEVDKVSPDDDISTATKKMKNNKIRRVPITQNNELVGMLTFKDVVQNIDDKSEIVDTISTILK